jgi:hypothetical protein
MTKKGVQDDKKGAQDDKMVQRLIALLFCLQLYFFARGHYEFAGGIERCCYLCIK